MSERLRPPHDDLVTAATFQDFAEAHIAMGALKAQGIPAWLLDANHVAVAPHLSIGVGIRLATPKTFLDRTRAVLAEACGNKAAWETCPSCGSGDIRRGRRLLVTFAHFLIAGIPVSAAFSRYRRCYTCGHTWRRDNRH